MFFSCAMDRPLVALVVLEVSMPSGSLPIWTLSNRALTPRAEDARAKSTRPLPVPLASVSALSRL